MTWGYESDTWVFVTIYILRCFKRFNFRSTYFIFGVSHPSFLRREKEKGERGLNSKTGLEVIIHILNHKVMSLSLLASLKRDKYK